MEKLTPLAKSLHCHWQWRHGQISPLPHTPLQCPKENIFPMTCSLRLLLLFVEEALKSHTHNCNVWQSFISKVTEDGLWRVNYDDVFASPWCCDSYYEDRYKVPLNIFTLRIQYPNWLIDLVSQVLMDDMHNLTFDSTVMVLLSVMCLFNCKGVTDLEAESTIVSHGQKFSLLLHRLVWAKFRVIIFSHFDTWALCRHFLYISTHFFFTFFTLGYFAGTCWSRRATRRWPRAGSTSTRRGWPSSERWQRFWSTRGWSADHLLISKRLICWSHADQPEAHMWEQVKSQHSWDMAKTSQSTNETGVCGFLKSCCLLCILYLNVMLHCGQKFKIRQKHG